MVVGALAHLAQLPAIDLTAVTESPDASAAMPDDVRLEFKEQLHLQFEGQVLVVAFAEPPSAHDVDALAARIGHRVNPVLADPVLVSQMVGNGKRPTPGPAPESPLFDPSTVGSSDSPPDRPTAETLLEKGISASAADGSVPLHVDDLLRYAVSVGASDLHLTASMPGTIRLHGAIRPSRAAQRSTTDHPRDGLRNPSGISARAFRSRTRIRHVSLHCWCRSLQGQRSLQRGRSLLRSDPFLTRCLSSIPSGLPDAIKSFTDLRRGLVLVTGPTGSGKSTTLASLVDIINRTKPLHIVTVEDPIEFLHDHKRSIITQREIGEDTYSFAEALRRVLRQDPDVILVGELRDLETISTALTAAETGHLVFATLHTQDAPQTIDRVIDVFPTNQQEQIRVMLAATLGGRGHPAIDRQRRWQGRVPCSEVLVCTSAIRNLIRQSKTHQIYSLMQVGGSFGMQTMDQGLAAAGQETGPFPKASPMTAHPMKKTSAITSTAELVHTFHNLQSGASWH